VGGSVSISADSPVPLLSSIYLGGGYRGFQPALAFSALASSAFLATTKDQNRSERDKRGLSKALLSGSGRSTYLDVSLGRSHKAMVKPTFYPG
jgi:hypothetical protein